MLYVDIPTGPEFKSLNRARADACVSIYLETTPLSQQADQGRIELGNLARTAREQLEANGFDKRRLADLMEHIDDVIADDDFWRLQANSLAVLATPDFIRTYRLANSLTPTVQVSDRFHIKPLLRAITFPHSAFVLALSENAVRVVEVFSDLPPQPVSVPNLPKSAADAIGQATLKSASQSTRVHGLEGQNTRLKQYARRVDEALRAVLSGRHTPLILAATGRLANVYRSVNSYPELIENGIDTSPDRMSESELANAARPVLDGHYQDELGALKALFAERESQGRATTDMSDAARAATYGAVEALLVDIDSVVPGTIDETSGEVTFAEAEGASSYGIVDEIAGRALNSGAKVLGVRREDLPRDGELAAILRYAV